MKEKEDISKSAKHTHTHTHTHTYIYIYIYTALHFEILITHELPKSVVFVRTACFVI
jgi:hypothetical protein